MQLNSEESLKNARLLLEKHDNNLFKVLLAARALKQREHGGQPQDIEGTEAELPLAIAAE